MSDEQDLKRVSEQYTLLSQEVLEIHSRSDRLELFFVATLGAIYGFALTRELNELQGYVFCVPIFISLFAFLRLELLSRVRAIIRLKQIDYEQILFPDKKGNAGHFQQEFYRAEIPSVSREVSILTLFSWQVSDRAVFWRWGVFFSIIIAVTMNWSQLTGLMY